MTTTTELEQNPLLEGLRLRLADLQGLFYFETFVPVVVEYRVLPVLADAGGRPAVHKRHNLLPPPGIHRHRRPGTGSELLDLREYLPGDPPKTIAWKVSARRDRLKPHVPKLVEYTSTVIYGDLWERTALSKRDRPS